MEEQFRPIAIPEPNTFWNWLKFQARLLIDFQVKTIYGDLKKVLPEVRGKVLDVGCGQNPYKHLLTSGKTEYYGIDIVESGQFGYHNFKSLKFDGKRIPFTDEQFDYVLCTEVLEHVEEPQKLVDEIYRVLKSGAAGVITVPWSARFHYIPYDYYRFSPVTLTRYFKNFNSHKVVPRGTDITVIVSKIIVIYCWNIKLSKKALLWPAKLIIAIALFPLVMLAVFIGHLSLFFRIGSIDDPLGYTIWLEKA
jgi:SAM-dependent methyltransferase